MTLQELRKALNKLDVEWIVKTNHTHSDEARGNNLVTVRFWIEEETDANAPDAK